MLLKGLGCLFLLLISYGPAYTQTPKPRKAKPASGLFQGVWAVSKDENAAFWVTGSRLTYVEFPDEPLRYILTPTKLAILAKDGPYNYRIKKLTPDSLVMLNSDNRVIRLYKRK